MKVDDNQETGLGKVGVDWGVNNEGDKILIGERYRKEREQLTLSLRRCERIECSEIFHEEITDCTRETSEYREHYSCEC